MIVWDYSRLARDLRGLNEIIGRIRDCGAEVVTTTGVTTVERFSLIRALDEVGDWAQKAVNQPKDSESDVELNTAIRTIRSGRLSRDQREALAALLSIAGRSDLPTTVTAAVFNAVKACQRTRATGGGE